MDNQTWLEKKWKLLVDTSDVPLAVSLYTLDLDCIYLKTTSLPLFYLAASISNLSEGATGVISEMPWVTPEKRCWYLLNYASSSSWRASYFAASPHANNV